MVVDSIGTHRIDGKRRYTAVARGPRGRSEASKVSESQLLGATGAGKPRLGDPRARRRCLRRVSLVEEHGTIKQTDTQCSDACQYSTIPALNTHRIIVYCREQRPVAFTNPSKKNFKPIAQRRSCCKVRSPRRWGNGANDRTATWHFSVHLFRPGCRFP
jgi:hypothetical protein